MGVVSEWGAGGGASHLRQENYYDGNKIDTPARQTVFAPLPFFYFSPFLKSDYFAELLTPLDGCTQDSTGKQVVFPAECPQTPKRGVPGTGPVWQDPLSSRRRNCMDAETIRYLLTVTICAIMRLERPKVGLWPFSSINSGMPAGNDFLPGISLHSTKSAHC